MFLEPCFHGDSPLFKLRSIESRDKVEIEVQYIECCKLKVQIMLAWCHLQAIYVKEVTGVPNVLPLQYLATSFFNTIKSSILQWAISRESSCLPVSMLHHHGLDGKQAAWASWKYRGHQIMPETVMEADPPLPHTDISKTSNDDK